MTIRNLVLFLQTAVLLSSPVVSLTFTFRTIFIMHDGYKFNSALMSTEKYG